MAETESNRLWRRIILLFLTAAFFAILVLPFAYRPAPTAVKPGVSPKSAGPARKLAIISPHWEGIRREFGRAFSAWTESELGFRADVEWLDVGGTSDAVRYVRSEFKRAPGGIDVDIFFGGGVDPYLQFKREGLLQPGRISPEVLGRIPRTFSGIEVYDRDHQWFGACLAGFGIIYNRKVLELLKLPEPYEWADLAAPHYFSWVGSGDPRSSGSVHMAYEIILQAYGWDRGWAVILPMAGNIRNFSRSGSDVPKDTALGEIACGLAIDVYAWRQVAEAGRDRIGFRLPEGLTVVNPDGVAILRGAPDAALAEKFIEFTLSEKGQKLWTLRRGAPGGPRDYELSRIPVIPGFAARAGGDAVVTFDPFQWKGGFVYDSHKGAQRWTLLNDLIGSVIIDNHNDLVDAWRQARKRDAGDPLFREFVQPPLPEKEAMAMAKEIWTNPEQRAMLRARWSAEARRRFLRMAGKD